MEDYQRIELYKKREFGEKLNATFTFLRQNAGPFLKAQLAISGPMAIVVALMYTLLIQGLTSVTNTSSADYIFSTQYFTTMGVTMIVYFLLIISMLLVTFSYVKIYLQDTSARPTVTQVFKMAMRKLGYGILALLMIYIIVFISAFLLFIPAIYFGVICSLVLPIMIIEDVNPFKALERAFNLIKGKWWSTFGLIVVTAIIAYIIMLVLVLPVSLSSVAVTLFDVESTRNIFEDGTFTWILAVMVILYYLGGIIGVSIMQLTLAFQYGNLVEMKESRGLMKEIEELGNEESTSASEGEY